MEKIVCNNCGYEVIPTLTIDRNYVYNICPKCKNIIKKEIYIHNIIALEESKLLIQRYKEQGVRVTSSLIDYIAMLTQHYYNRNIPVPVIGTTSFNLYHILEIIRRLERRFSVYNFPIILVGNKTFSEDKKNFFKKISPLYIIRQSSAPSPEELVKTVRKKVDKIIETQSLRG